MSQAELTSAEVAGLRQRVRTAIVIVLVLTIGFILELMGFLWWSYARVQATLDPENIVATVERQIQQQWPEARSRIEQAAEERAPELAQAVSQRLLDSAPDAREYLAEVLDRQMDWAFAQANELSVEALEAYIRENPEQVQRWLATLEAAPERIDRHSAELDGLVESVFGTELREVIEQTIEVWAAFNERFARVANPAAALSPRELLEQRILRILRTLAPGGGEESGS